MVNIGNSWDALLAEEFQKEYYQKLRRVLRYEYQHHTIYPDMHAIFNALRYTAYEDVRAVILGQDPYHGPGQAHGLCFSVQDGTPLPPSLQNIFKEVENETGAPMPSSGSLVRWARQGVLLLNTVLTVRQGRPNSHKGLGWERLTDRVVALLNQREQPLVFLLWGANAAGKRPLLTNPRHLVLQAAHPSPLSAFRGFFGCGHFVKANEFLRQTGQAPVVW